MSSASRISQRGVPSVVRRVLHSGRAWTIQGIGTLLFLALAYAWLWIHEARWLQLAGSFLLALFLAYLAVFLQRSALRIFRRERLSELGLKPASARARPVRQWLPGAVLVFFLFAALAGMACKLHAELPDAAQSAASWLTLHLRRPVDPDRLTQRVQAAEFVGVWFAFVVLWLPLAAAALVGESELWGVAMRAWRSLRYWLATLVCAVVGHTAFWKLAEWVPKAKGIAMETASMLARFAVGYVIALGAWLVILALVEEAIAAPQRSPDDTWDGTERPY